MIIDYFTNLMDYFCEVTSQSNRSLYFGGHGLTQDTFGKFLQRNNLNLRSWL